MVQLYQSKLKQTETGRMVELRWTEILREAGIPEAPGYEEAKERMRLRKEKLEESGEVVVPKRKRSYKRRSTGKR